MGIGVHALHAGEWSALPCSRLPSSLDLPAWPLSRWLAIESRKRALQFVTFELLPARVLPWGREAREWNCRDGRAAWRAADK
jgi:hypothetical protein